MTGAVKPRQREQSPGEAPLRCEPGPAARAARVLANLKKHAAVCAGMESSCRKVRRSTRRCTAAPLSARQSRAPARPSALTQRTQRREQDGRTVRGGIPEGFGKCRGQVERDLASPASCSTPSSRRPPPPPRAPSAPRSPEEAREREWSRTGSTPRHPLPSSPAPGQDCPVVASAHGPLDDVHSVLSRCRNVASAGCLSCVCLWRKSWMQGRWRARGAEFEQNAKHVRTPANEFHAFPSQKRAVPSFRTSFSSASRSSIHFHAYALGRCRDSVQKKTI
jgi:hypothetical protein